MPTAIIITNNPESTESLETYLRDEGYDVVYARPGEVHSSSGELAITVEDCVNPMQALTRAHELASQLGCDVFVGEGIVETLNLETVAMPEAETETEAGLVPQPETPSESEFSEALDSAPNLEAPEQVSHGAAWEVEGNREAASDGVESISVQEEPPAHRQEPVLELSRVAARDSQVPSLGAASPEVLDSPAVTESEVHDLLKAKRQEEAAAYAPPSQLGRRAWHGAKELVRLQTMTLLEGARSSSQVLKIRASAKLEQFLLWQQVRTAALIKHREEKRQLAEKTRRQAMQQAALERAAAAQKFALRRQEPADNHNRDWKVALAGAGVAALLIFFVLGVFTGRNPATSQISAAEKSLQLNTTTRPGANLRAPLLQTAVAHGPAVNPQANNDSHMPAVLPATSATAAGFTTAPQEQAAVHRPAMRPAVHRPVVEAADSEPEVIVRHFSRTKAHSPARRTAGVRHYSDLN